MSSGLQSPVPKNRSIPSGQAVGLVLIGRKQHHPRFPNLVSLAEKYNRAQRLTKAFRFVALGEVIRVATRLPPGKHALPNKEYFDRLEAQMQLKGNLSAVIGLTMDDLEDNRFNAHSSTSPVGIVTTRDMEEVCPQGMGVDQYLAYLILCEAYCTLAGEDLETSDQQGCLFDRCDDKDWLLECLKTPKISDQSQRKLLEVGFAREQVDASSEVLRSYIGKRRLSLSATGRKVGTFAAGFSSGVLTHLTAAVVHDASRAATIIVALLAGIVLIVSAFFLRGAPTSKKLTGGH